MARKNSTIKILLVSLCLMFVLSSCAIDTTYPGTMNVVEAAKVISDSASDANVVVIDARSAEDYAKGHMEGAINLAPSELVVDTPVPATLAPKDQVEAVLSSKGIANDSVVYVYDANGGVNSARVWWTLKVYGHQTVMIVNGGANALVNAGAVLTLDAPAITPTQYVASDANTAMIATFDEVSKYAEQPQEGVVILDVRSLAEYEAGYIPGAVLYPHTNNLYSDGTFMSSRDIGLFYGDKDIQKDDTIIVYCGSGFRASQAVALLQEAGFENVKLYDGSWAEWSTKGDVAAPAEDEAPVGASDGS
ncbi:MAG: thiosulfate/3-mercaptopyruvate sulfurtransferase [Clostridiales bacterium]|nr:thiosulfate/3-mercaptopyruvate sulfurtransferase [Clostridiales bacterium]